jgi:hypothetical protein
VSSRKTCGPSATATILVDLVSMLLMHPGTLPVRYQGALYCTSMLHLGLKRHIHTVAGQSSLPCKCTHGPEVNFFASC